MTGIFLQVRLDSARLPGKALLKLGDRTVIEHAMAALSRVEADYYLLLTDEKSAAELRPYAQAGGFTLFEGPKEDVLLRFAEAARMYGCERVLRATGDNPLVSAEAASLLCSMHADYRADYSGFRGLPLGTGVECIETSALFEAEESALNLREREHVCPYLYEHSDRFRIYRPQAPPALRYPDGRVTLDTREDYERLAELYRYMYRGEPITTRELVRYLSRHHLVAG